MLLSFYCHLSGCRQQPAALSRSPALPSGRRRPGRRAQLSSRANLAASVRRAARLVIWSAPGTSRGLSRDERRPQGGFVRRGGPPESSLSARTRPGVPAAVRRGQRAARSGRLSSVPRRLPGEMGRPRRRRRPRVARALRPAVGQLPTITELASAVAAARRPSHATRHRSAAGPR